MFDWLGRQLATPSTHNALAILSQVLMSNGVLPPPYGMIATGIFLALGVVVPEAGEKAKPVPTPAVSRMLIPFILIIGMSVSACANFSQQQAQSAACVAQSVSNATGTSAAQANDTKLAQSAAISSALFGSLCTGLSSDTPLTVTPSPVNALPKAPA